MNSNNDQPATRRLVDAQSPQGISELDQVELLVSGQVSDGAMRQLQHPVGRGEAVCQRDAVEEHLQSSADVGDALLDLRRAAQRLLKAMEGQQVGGGLTKEMREVVALMGNGH